MKITSAADAGLIVNAAIRSHATHWEKIRETEDYLMNYKPPHDAQVLNEEKKNWQANWNYGKGRMIIEQGVIANVIDINRSIALGEIQFPKFNKDKHKDKVYSFLQDVRLRSTFSERIMYALDYILSNDPRVDAFLKKIEYNSFAFGYGPIIRDHTTYLGHPVSLRNIAFEDRTMPSKIGDFVVFDFMKAEELFDILVDHKNQISEKRTGSGGVEYHVYGDGWVKEGMEDEFICGLNTNEELKKELADAIKDKKSLPHPNDGKGNLAYKTWEDVESLIAGKGETWIKMNTSNIFLGRIFVLDKGEEIFECYVSLTGDINTIGATVNTSLGVKQHLLFIKNHGRQSYSNFISLVLEFAINEKDFIQALRGCSKQVVEESLRFDIKKCAMEDKLLLTGNLLVQETDGLNGQAQKIKVYSGMTVLPEGLQIPQGQIRYELSDHVISVQQDDGEFKERMGGYTPTVQLSNRPNKDEVQLKSQQYSQARTAKSPFKLKEYSKLMHRILLDLTDKDFSHSFDNEQQQKIFFETLEDEFSEFNLTIEDIKKIIKCATGVILVAANSDINAIQQAMPLVQSSDARKRLTKQYFLALGFSHLDIKTFVEVGDYGDQTEKAALENAAFYNTAEVVFDKSQDHLAHLDLHFPKVDRMLKGIQGGEDPIRNFNYLVNILTNTERHVEEGIKGNYFYGHLYEEKKSLQDYFEAQAKKVAAMIEKMKANQQANPGQQGIPPELLHEFKMDELKLQHDNQITAQRSQDRAEMKKVEMAERLRAKQAEAEFDKNLKTQSAQTDADLKRLQTASTLA